MIPSHVMIWDTEHIKSNFFSDKARVIIPGAEGKWSPVLCVISSSSELCVPFRLHLAQPAARRWFAPALLDGGGTQGPSRGGVGGQLPPASWPCSEKPV